MFNLVTTTAVHTAKGLSRPQRVLEYMSNIDDSDDDDLHNELADSPEGWEDEMGHLSSPMRIVEIVKISRG